MSSKNLILSGKKILITGGLGFIGSNLAHKCVQLGAHVTIFDNLNPRAGGNLFNISDIRSKIQLSIGDILDFQHLCQSVIEQDIIFNCAASTSHPYSMREPLIDIDINDKGVIHILEALRRFNNRAKFVQIGTTTQLGTLIYKPADENHPEFPKDVYSANKSASEKYTLIYGQSYGIPTTVIRLPNVFGPRATINSSEFTFCNFFIGLVLQNKEITIYGEGIQLRNIIYIDDCVDALICCALSEKSDGEVFFAVSDYHYSVKDFASIAIQVFDSGSIRYIPWPKERESLEFGDALISNKKIKTLLGWSPKFTLEQGLIETKKYYISCLKEYI